MLYKHDWDEAQDRLSRLWRGEPPDRPCTCVTAWAPGLHGGAVAGTGAGAGTQQIETDAEAFWLHPTVFPRRALSAIENTWWGGEAVPSFLLQAGWVACYGAGLHFGSDTIWHEPIAIDFDEPPHFRLDWNDRWIEKLVALYDAMLEAAGWDKFLVGQPCVLPGNDLLAAILGPTTFLESLCDEPEWVALAIMQLGEAQIKLLETFRTQAAAKHAFPYGNAGWMPFWAPEPYVQMQSDVSCMVSPDMFEEFIVPELELASTRLGPLWYHLDGFAALQHLPRLLSFTCIKVIQFIPEPDKPPNGREWLHLYRRIQEAGKIVHITASAQEALGLAKALDPSLLCLDVRVPDRETGEELLKKMRCLM